MNTSTERTYTCLRAFAVSAVAFVQFLSCASVTEAAPQCPVVRYDVQATGQAGSYTADPIFEWRIAANSPYAPVIGSDGTLYFGTGDKCFYAYSPTGTVDWMYRTETNVSGSAAISADGTIYVGTTGRLIALSSEGAEKWSSPFKFASTAAPSSIVVDGSGTIYFGADKRLYAVNPDGTLKWSCLTGGAIRYGASISPDGSKIYATGSDGRAYAINAANGTILWQSESLAAVYNCAVGDDGSVLVGSMTGKLYSFSADGTQNWTFQMQSKVTCAPAIAADGTIYTGSQDTNLYALDPLGNQKWYYRTGGPIYSAPTIGTDGSILFGAWPGTLCCLDPVEGALEWSRSLGATIYAPPIMDESGAIYVLCTNGTITKYASTAVPAETPEPSAILGLVTLLGGLGAGPLSRALRRRK